MSALDEKRASLIRRIYENNAAGFEGVALEVWEYQYEHNPLYRRYCDIIHPAGPVIRDMADIPFLPITMFREHEIKTGLWESESIFRSSGTTGAQASRHHIRDRRRYHQTADICFSQHFGPPASYAWLGLLPSYLERPDSSLVDMVHAFMESSDRPGNIFFPGITDELLSSLNTLEQNNTETVMIGVSFALLNLFEQHDVPVWDNLLVIETGGMKGRRHEITRDELHARLQKDHRRLRIVSEYGMTELLSQAYKPGEHFIPPPFMQVMIRDISDPLQIVGPDRRGGINIIDLANIDTCSFIATDDVGIVFSDNSFDVLGRLDNSDLRGCNLLYEAV